ncbi:MAG TPA: HNH endonuclease [Streptosporangiaceae bacterium]|nr:HNH endonuclease [Streptosporangiaceae bacterium]
MAKPRVDDPLTANQLRALLDYDPATGIFTWRRRDQIGHHARTWNTRYAGTVAGTPTRLGYIQIMANGWLYVAHRLAYLWMVGEWPEDEVDHRDGDGMNNRWNNLRPATRSQGLMNTRKRSDNTSGHKGVWFDKRRKRWVAEVQINGKKHIYGNFASLEDAVAARDHGARRLHGKFARTA